MWHRQVHRSGHRIHLKGSRGWCPHKNSQGVSKLETIDQQYRTSCPHHRHRLCLQRQRGGEKNPKWSEAAKLEYREKIETWISGNNLCTMWQGPHTQLDFKGRPSCNVNVTVSNTNFLVRAPTTANSTKALVITKAAVRKLFMHVNIRKADRPYGITGQVIRVCVCSWLLWSRIYCILATPSAKTDPSSFWYRKKAR